MIRARDFVSIRVSVLLAITDSNAVEYTSARLYKELICFTTTNTVIFTV